MLTLQILSLIKLARNLLTEILCDYTETDEELGGLKSLEDSEELVHEITGKEASGTAFQPSKTNQDAENMAVRFLSRRSECFIRACRMIFLYQ